ncbi:MAG TPA: hypothetical protein VHG28_02810 [Longimicrobiaceae bacterium]|nr:hypothetical protein [Longimicrobiaceae bacterium]
MDVLLVTYDLNAEKSKDDYEGFYGVIKQGAWARLSESAYVISTSSSPAEVFDQLRPYIDENDRVLVIRLEAPWAGRHAQEVVDWLRKYAPFVC